MNRIALWHQCRYGNHFGSWADENVPCPVCGITEEMPKVRYLYDDLTPLNLLEGNLVNRDTYPELHETWTGGEYA